MRRRVRPGLDHLLLVATIVAAALGPLGTASGAIFQPLSADHSRVLVDSTRGSGVFGTWSVDRFGLPVYDYTLDQRTNLLARQEELNGGTNAVHQLGNGRIIGDAFNHGYVQLWSADRVYQWTNRYLPAARHYAGGYGYLRVDGTTVSTLYDDELRGAGSVRRFGMGYYEHTTSAHGVTVTEDVFAPTGDDPVLDHNVVLTNASRGAKDVTWSEYWDVDPFEQHSPSAPLGEVVGDSRGLAVPRFDPAQRLLSVAQLPTAADRSPLTIFAAAIRGPVSSYETSTEAFFGSGDRAHPVGAATPAASDSVAAPTAAGQVGNDLFVLRAPVHLRPGQSMTLRYAYGMAHPRAIGPILARQRAAVDPLATTERDWARWVPQVSLGSRYAWLSRELQWDAYMLRSGSTYEECAGHHIISQGGYYQYQDGAQEAFRDPLQMMLPMVYLRPELAREVLLYSAGEQPLSGQFPEARFSLCHGVSLGTSDDLDLWFLWSAAEYGLATRDLRFFDDQAPYSDGGAASVWDHLKRAFVHQESLVGPHGGYLIGSNGDWTDGARGALGMQESMLVPAQLAYVYPRLAELARARGDHAFATRLDARAAQLRLVLRGQWTGQGWYARGYRANGTQVGHGVIFGEPQPWDILAGVPDTRQARVLVANIRRFLTGVGAPAQLHGPSKIGSSLSPARNDPGITETSGSAGIVGTNNAVYFGGTWYAINGPLTWALSTLAGRVPHAADDAFDELERNTLTAHAAAFPRHWDGILSVDDACNSFYERDPARCGARPTGSTFNTQAMEQPAWSLFAMIKLAGIFPTANGYRIEPNLPQASFSLRTQVVGIAREAGQLRGYVRPEADSTLRMQVRISDCGCRPPFATSAGSRPVRHTVRGGYVYFTLHGTAHQLVDWALR